MTWFESFSEAVVHGGSAVSAQADNASGLAWRYLRTLADAMDFAIHPAVVAAVGRYHDTWQPRVNNVAATIDSQGARTRGAANTIAQHDDDAAGTLHHRNADVTTNAANVSRPINHNMP